MKTSKFLFFTLLCGIVPTVFADSFLTAQSFPEPFKDTSFGDKMEFEKKDYAQYAPEYDEDTGQCIKNCPFPGLNLKTKEESIALGLLIDPNELEDEEDTADIVFDENGTCISGCEEENITYEEFMENIDQAGSDFEDLANNYGPAQPGDFDANAPAWCTSINTTTKLPMRPPVDMGGYTIVSDFHYRYHPVDNKWKMHPAVDIGTSVGTPVYATADGVVDMAGWDSGGGGNVVSISHDAGLRSQYMHLSKILVKKNDHVKACQQIALSGNTGKSTGPHLDYRVRFGRTTKYIDPLCPCKATTRKNQTTNTNVVGSCNHSLFNTGYRFKSGRKRSKWRIDNGHCMVNATDKLPDEVR